MQIFHRSTNTISKVSIFGAVFLVAGLLGLFDKINRSSWVTEAQVPREQPIQFSHERHVAGNGLDCRFCHSSVEQSSFAGIPPTRTCMSVIRRSFSNSPFLEPVRASFRTGRSIEWTRVHDLPDFVYFDHSVHVNKGVGCTTCHGPVDRMPLMWQGTVAADGMVHRLSPPARSLRAPARGRLFASTTSRRPISSPWDAGSSPRTTSSSLTKLLDVPPDGRLPISSGARRRIRRRPGVRDHLCNEFPSQIEAIVDPVARRSFLKLMGASLALGGLTACTRQPAETIVPYVRQPEDLVPGKPLYYATAMTMGGAATGLLVESHEGRPTKIEGNTAHPGSLGASDVFAQAAILGLYDPDRSQTLTNLGDIRPWPELLGALRAALVAQQGARRARGCASSPRTVCFADARRPDSRSPPPLSCRALASMGSAGARQRAPGRAARLRPPSEPQYHLNRADRRRLPRRGFLASGPGHLRHARDFSSRRRTDRPDRMTRLYAVEGMPTVTGSRADHRLPLKPRHRSVARRLAAAAGAAAASSQTAGGPLPPGVLKWIAAVANDLAAHRGAGLVIAGESQRPRCMPWPTP